MTQTLTITEYATLNLQLGGQLMQVPQEPPVAEQTLGVTSSSAQSAAFNKDTTLVRLNADGGGAIAITFGVSPTATVPSGGAGSGRLSANATEYRGVAYNSGLKLAAIATT